MIKKCILLLLASFGVVGCIENDIPYPLIYGNVESIDVSGSVGEARIDFSNRTVNITLADTVDLRRVWIKSMSVTSGASCTLDSTAVIDITSANGYDIDGPYRFTISTYQDYQWSLIFEQPIDRKIKLSGSIGEASFDTNNFIALVNVSLDQDLFSVVVEEFQLAPSNAVYTPNPFAISNFSGDVDISVEYLNFTEHWTIRAVPTDINVITGVSNPWSTFCYLYGDVLASSTLQAGFEYRVSGSEEWTTVDVQGVNGKIECVVSGLIPNTEYEYRAYLGDEEGETEVFRTDTTPEVQNLNFQEAILMELSNKAYPVWYFNSTGTNSYWATGNEGITGSIPNRASNTTSVSDGKISRAVRMETYNGVAMVSVAAGNLFTGTYTDGWGVDPVTLMNLAQMGRPYSGRPSTLSGWFKYQPGVFTPASYWSKVNETPFAIDFEGDFLGKSDTCHIYIALEVWPDGSESRPSDASQIQLIGYGEFQTSESVPSYEEFVIEVEYFDTVQKPTHISIVATSSKYGGYFCGAAGSVLYVDEFSLGWDYLGD